MGDATTTVWHQLYGGMPWWAAVVFSAALLVIVTGMVWNTWLFVLAKRHDRSEPPAGDESDFMWVFLVPALDEEVTIADSVGRLLESRCTNRRVVVIDDGSTDRTPDLLAALAHPELLVVRRDLPDARRGKAAALNDAWSRLDQMARDGHLGGFGPDRTIVVVVDADGRLDPAAACFVAGWFEDPGIGGVQVRVRIYNRQRPLTWCQDVEFGVFGMLYQSARSRLGTAGMGGNGQFNRLSALDDLATRSAMADRPAAPWRDRLTEDQDLGLQLVEAGWRCVHDNRTQVDQQGVPGIRRLFRQRTRWSQGNLQAMAHLRKLRRVPLSVGARLDLHLWLLQPVLQAVVGVAMATAVLVWATRGEGFLPGNWAMAAVFYLLGFAGVILGCIARCGRGPLNWLRGWLLANVFAGYTWMLWPVLVRSTWRQATHHDGWAKTQRESIEDEPAAGRVGAATR